MYYRLFAIEISGSKNYLEGNRIIGNATDSASINDGGTGTIYVNQQTNSASDTAEVTDFTTRGSANSTTAFAVQNAAGTRVINVDTTNGELEIGSYNGGTNSVGGALVVANTTNANTVSIKSGVTSASYDLVLPTSAGAVDECLMNDGTTPGVLVWGTCGGGSSLFTDGGTFTYLTDGAEDLAVGGTTQAAAKLFVDVSASNLYVGQVDTTNGTITFNVASGSETEPTISSNATGDLAITAPSGTVVVGSGTGDVQITPDATSAVTIGNSAGTGNIDIGTGTGAQALNFGTGGTGAKTVTVGSTASTGTTTLQAGSGGIVLAGFNCTSFTNGGAITADASGVLSCSNDDGGAGSGDNITVNGSAAN